MAIHTVFGAGLIGCYLAGALIKQGQQTRLVCRTQVRQKLENGLLITDYLGHEYKARELHLCEQFLQEENGDTDFLWLTVKCHSVQDAANQLKGVIADNTVILCCQNGLGSEQIIKQLFPTHIVLRVMVPFNVVELKPGHLHRGSEGQLTLEQHMLTDALASIITSDLLPLDVSTDMSALLWAKLQLNLGNAVNALAHVPVKTMLEQRGYRLVIAALMDELLQVARGSAIQLPKVTAVRASWIPKVLRLPNWLFKRLANKMLAIDPQVRTSMWWDLQANKNTEIDYLNGAVVQQGLQVNVPCPINQKLINLIKQAELGKLKQGISPSQLQQMLGLD